jgi:hypothetical protein
MLWHHRLTAILMTTLLRYPPVGVHAPPQALPSREQAVEASKKMAGPLSQATVYFAFLTATLNLAIIGRYARGCTAVHTADRKGVEKNLCCRA